MKSQIATVALLASGAHAFTAVSCWSKGSQFDTLDGDAFWSSSLTVEKCSTLCTDYIYFGVSAGKECYCGDDLANSAVDESLCTTKCAGNSAEYCGSSSTLNIYKNKDTGASLVPSAGGFSHQSCWTNPSASRALTYTGFTSARMTVEKCAGFCGDFEYFGVGNGRECYCGDSLSTSSESATECSSPCEGDKTQLCGGVGKINFSTAPAAPTYTPPFPAVRGFEWDNCWEEITTAGRLLNGATTAADDMTLEKCADFCHAWPYFGVEYGRECYCGLVPAPSGKVAASIEECHFSCPGDTAEKCGAGMRVSVYHTTTTGPTDRDDVAGSTRHGCMTEGGDGRALQAKAFATDGMTLEVCEATCAGYTYWGVEYGRECYCGNDFNPTSQKVNDSECDMMCMGDSTQLCGAGNRLMAYKRERVVVPNSPLV
ncbi:WSC domain-containing protein [Apodospora peruviana]|uniref:WSC domain-containing protein n=1 Tax=Apodospora peruviana TaxID=516989 RepID=A0AAE0MAU2_9PEZI|nr:WSC domain-containing protein [Apodospora peruviana]